MDVSPDFRDLLNEFNAAGVRCLVVGASAVSYHAEPRHPKDPDLCAGLAGGRIEPFRFAPTRVVPLAPHRG